MVPKANYNALDADHILTFINRFRNPKHANDDARYGKRKMKTVEYFRKSRAAFSGKPLDDFSNIHPLCEKCPYNSSIMNQYVPYEKQIIENFWIGVRT